MPGLSGVMVVPRSSPALFFHEAPRSSLYAYPRSWFVTTSGVSRQVQVTWRVPLAWVMPFM